MLTDVSHCLFKNLRSLAYHNNNAIVVFGRGFFLEYKENMNM